MAEKFTHIDTANVANIIAHALAIYSIISSFISFSI